MRVLPSVASVTFDIPTETFAVELREAGPVDVVLSTIRGLGFDPVVIDAPVDGAAELRRLEDPASPVLRAALRRATSRDVPLVIDFGGAFCSSCRAFERLVLGEARVQEALRAFELLKVDIEKDPTSAGDLGVTAVPDIWVLAGDGLVLARENRTMDAAAFLALLAQHAPR